MIKDEITCAITPKRGSVLRLLIFSINYLKIIFLLHLIYHDFS